MKNLLPLTPDPQNAIPIHGRDPEEINPLTDLTNSAIDFALRKHLSPDECDKIINGYRRSPWNEDALKHDISTLDSDEHTVPKDEHYWNAITHVAKLIKPDKPLQAVHFADLRHYKWRLSTNIGAPFASSPKWQEYVKAKFQYFQNGIPFENIAHRDLFTEAHHNSQPLEISDARMTKHNLYTEAFFITRKNIHNIKLGKTEDEYGNDYKYWNTAFARQHLVETDDPDKVRLVYGAPFTLLCAELMFIWTLQVHLLLMQGSRAFMLWGFETILGGWYRLRNFFSRFAPRHTTVVTLDWSMFDKLARHTVIKDIHAHVLRPCYDFTAGYHPTNQYRTHGPPKPGDLTIEEKLENLWTWMTSTILDIPLLLPDGTKLQFTHSGIFSGYFQTQILDSLYNMVMIFTILSKMGFDLDKVVIKVQGDDSIFMLLCVFILIAHSFLRFFQFYATHYFGSKVSMKKSEIRSSLEDAEVLRYRNRGGLPYRDEIQLLAQLRHPERRTDPSAVMARCIGIAYAAVGDLPRTHAICEDIYLFLQKAYHAEAAQTELNFMFRHLDEQAIPKGDHFPTYLEVVQHLMDNPHNMSDHHWPRSSDPKEFSFLGLPGRH
nr:MAG: RNA-dependent RNA polymerase [Flammulina alphapartitivirus 2]